MNLILAEQRLLKHGSGAVAVAADQEHSLIGRTLHPLDTGHETDRQIDNLVLISNIFQRIDLPADGSHHRVQLPFLRPQQGNHIIIDFHMVSDTLNQRNHMV